MLTILLICNYTQKSSKMEQLLIFLKQIIDCSAAKVQSKLKMVFTETQQQLHIIDLFKTKRSKNPMSSALTV